MKTYDAATYREAKRQWEEGDFGYRWQRVRRIAADRGFLYPPSGSVHDTWDWTYGSPSQRAIIWHALEDNPTEVERIVAHCSSWSQVVDRIIGMEDRLAAEAGLADRNDQWDKKGRPTHRDDAMTLAQIIRRIEDSAA